MIEKRKLESDKKLIQVLFATEPLDWARRDDGTLVFLYQDGRKMVVTPEDLALLTDKKLAEKEVAQRKTAAAPPAKEAVKVYPERSEGLPPAPAPPAAKPAAAAVAPVKPKPKK